VLKCVLAAKQCHAEVLKEKKVKPSQTPLLAFEKKESIQTPEPHPSSSGISKTKYFPLSVAATSLVASLSSSPTGSCNTDDPLPLYPPLSASHLRQH
jgi:hypothetical protein